jgi:hypothetical protein
MRGMMFHDSITRMDEGLQPREGTEQSRVGSLKVKGVVRAFDRTEQNH